jgi:hypothetical protein
MEVPAVRRRVLAMEGMVVMSSAEMAPAARAVKVGRTEEMAVMVALALVQAMAVLAGTRKEAMAMGEPGELAELLEVPVEEEETAKGPAVVEMVAMVEARVALPVSMEREMVETEELAEN